MTLYNTQVLLTDQDLEHAQAVTALRADDQVCMHTLPWWLLVCVRECECVLVYVYHG